MTTKQRSDFLDSMGRYKTQSLFLETAYDSEAFFTFDDVDKVYKGKTYTSLKRLYLEMEDVTEYAFADAHLAGWNHWKKICGNSAIREHIEDWRYELELKLTARAMSKIKEMAEEGNYNAAKYIANKEYSSGKGRPTKADKEAALKRATLTEDSTKAEGARILELIKGKSNG
jgi:hypothetical protein